MSLTESDIAWNFRVYDSSAAALELQVIEVLQKLSPMDFRDYAAKETSVLLARLLAGRSEIWLEQLRALRDSFDAAARAAETAADSAPQFEADVQELVRRLNNAASAAVRASAQRFQDEAAERIAAIQTDLDAERSRGEELAALLAEVQAQNESLRSDLRSEIHRASVAERDLSTVRALQDELDAARLAAEAAAEEHARARAAAEDELRETRGLLDTALSEAAGLHGQLDAEASERDGLHEELGGLRDNLERAEAAARDAEQARTSAEEELHLVQKSLEDAIAEAARLSVQLDDGATERAALIDDLTATRHTVQRLESSLVDAEALAREQSQARAAAEHELHLLRRSLEDAIEDAARLTVQLEEAAAEKGTMLADLSVARTEIDEVRAQLAGVEAERDFNRSSVLGLELVQAGQAETIRDLENRLESARSAEASVRAAVAGSEQALAGGRAEIGALEGQVARLQSLLEDSVRAADELSGETTITGLLTGIVRQLSSVYSRVALFRLKGNRLEGEHQIGFDLNTDVTKLVIPLSVDSLIARAAISRDVESLTGSELDDSRHAPFGSSAAAAFAFPVVVNNETLAVLYAEQPGDHSSLDLNRRPMEQLAIFAKLLVRHAVALLMRLTQELKALSELREYAVMLLQEAEQMYSADTESGKADTELQRRLKDTIDCARQLYAQRAALDGPTAASLFDDQIVAAIESRAGTPFARDLAACVGQPEQARRAAEAS